MRFNKLKISADATSRLRSIRQKTGLTPNLLCRIAIMLSLEAGPIGTPESLDEDGQEFNAYTLTGDYNGLLSAMLRFVEEEADGRRLEDDEFLLRLRAHIQRGVGTLSVRAKGPADLARLAVAA